MIVRLKSLFRILLRKRNLAILAVILFLLFLTFRNNSKNVPITTATVKTQDIQSIIAASGVVSAKDSATLHFGSSGNLAWVNVKEGDTVTLGEAIASLDQERFQIALRQAQQAVVAADAALQKTYDSLPKDKPESFADKVTRTSAEATKNQAFDSQKEAERQLRESTIYSPLNGTVISFEPIAGEAVTPATDIATVADINFKLFKTDVDETDVGKIKVGQEAKISLDAYPEKTIDSTVEKIAESATTTSTGATAFEVTFSIPEDEAYKIGMNGEAQIVTASASQATTIPFDGLIDEKYVFVKHNSTYEKKEVQTGIESDTDIQIVSGLSEGEEIVTSGSEQIGKKSFLQTVLPFIFK